jgi:hypothetical protein
MKVLFTITLLYSVIYAQSQPLDSLVLVKSGKPNYCIHVESVYANPASLILQAYVDSISGAQLYLLNKNESRTPCVFFKDGSEIPADNIKKDGFIIHTNDKNIIVYANDTAGFRNAVYYILEKRMGCHYYAAGALNIPRHKSVVISPVNTVQNPTFEFRVNYNGGAFSKSYAEWHGLNNKSQDENATGFEISDDWGLWVHTLHRLLPPETWFKSHPEYFALRNGVRVPDQLCLSNPEVLKIVIASLKKEIEKNPKAQYWSVSQMDNFNFCQCEKCRAIDDVNGSPSGSIITFVNAVAKKFPDKIISTLAYQYSRKAPSQVKPLPNVNIMLCTIECDRNKPISADESEGSFKNDLEQWGKLTNNILVWDYVINFSNIIGPFPNFNVLKPNMQLFEKNRVNMLFEQGWPRMNGEFTELRCYLLSKLMWNPSLNTDSLMQDFCNGYYGKGGKFVYQYIQQSTQNLIQSQRSLTLYEPMSAHAQGFLSPKNLDSYFMLFDKALNASNGNKMMEHRIQMAMQPLRYAWLEVAKSLPFTDNWIFVKNNKGKYETAEWAKHLLKQLCDTAEKYGPDLFHEISIKPKEYFERMTKYFADGVQMHKAVGKRITFATPYSIKYEANGPGSLVDGVCGTENYFVLWQGWYGDDVDATIDLGSEDTISKVELNCLANSMSWIFPPESITVLSSLDGKNFAEISTLTNADARNKPDKQIVPFKIEFSKPQQCRYLEIKIKNIGKLPDWRGVDGNAWLFVDELIVK